jgi:hypothetical protein
MVNKQFIGVMTQNAPNNEFKELRLPRRYGAAGIPARLPSMATGQPDSAARFETVSSLV